MARKRAALLSGDEFVLGDVEEGFVTASSETKSKVKCVDMAPERGG